ncbi:SnoaL-like domain-containing protein [Dyella jiangningensis]|uniref:nuclear transport factor 2 family protein n=1 Tax=Dyella sp. AtDHG13 TaxID=1938897 RepID=UPI0008884065|nr:nuclear transport factor 2 family protein [Dyella sp. AtDHG13]PXV61401.1 SnoaL-like protein [Dyella sp. AtDHG13]SDJ91402.1 SnoaL-like domain-containing protein [Dyella jiangningensis]
MNPSTAMLLGLAMGAMADVPTSPESVVRAMFDAFNRHDAGAMAGLYASDARLSSSDFCSPRAGRAEVMRTYRELFAAFPDIRDDIEQVVVQGNQVAVRFVARSQATGKPLRLPISTFLTVEQGRIVSDDSTFDTSGRPCVP